uniref:Protein kinase domain-containing protein n=1 Tax=Ditylenchus dipsaci TaxID=166011 RepID=A0A915EG25_9BILA
MSSGSMSRFLQRARSSGAFLSIKAWKKWTTQILSALQYLHSCDPPIVHANLTCNTIFIQQNGLIKIGCVAPNAIHHHVKTFRENLKNIHYIAPDANQATTQADIYSFGICALEMATTGALQQDKCNGVDPTSTTSTSTFSQGQVTPESIRKAIDSLEDQMQKDFIEKCLQVEPERRPSAQDLLFHPVLFEVHSLKLIAAHSIVRSKLADQLGEDDLHVQDGSRMFASTKFKQITYAELPTFQVDLDKFLEDVRNGIYPLSAFGPLAHLPIKTTKNFTSSPSLSNITTADIRALSAGANGMLSSNEAGAGLADSSHPSTSNSKANAGGDEHHRGGFDQHDNSSTFSSTGALTEGSIGSTGGGGHTTSSHQHQHKDGYTGGEEM